MPLGLKEIGIRAFSKCKNLAEVELSEGLKRLSISCFCESGLEKIRIPASVEIIDNNAFYNCDKLKKVLFREGSKLERIGACCF